MATIFNKETCILKKFEAISAIVCSFSEVYFSKIFWQVATLLKKSVFVLHLYIKPENNQIPLLFTASSDFQCDLYKYHQHIHMYICLHASVAC